MMRLILRSTDVNDDSFNNAKTNCLPKHRYLIMYYYFDENFRDYIRFKLYKDNNQINKESIVEILTK